MSEQIMILKMLEEGKITLEEADALLEALGMNDETLSKKKQDRVTQSSKIFDDNEHEFIEEIEEEFERMDDELDQVEDELDEQLNELNVKMAEVEMSESLDAERKAVLSQKIKEAREKLEEKRKKVIDRRSNLKEKQQEYARQYESETSNNSDIYKGLDEMSKGVRDFAYTIEREGLDEAKRAMREVALQINEGMRELRSGLNEGAREMRKAFRGSEFRDMLNNFFRSFSFAGFGCITIEEDLTGNFDSVPVMIDLKTGNGQIEIIGTDEPDYKLHLKYNIHADSEEEAQQLKEEMCTINQTSSSLQVFTRGGYGSVSAHLYIPRKTEGDIKLKTSNGSIYVTGLRNKGLLELQSSNGRLELTDLRIKEFIGQSSNGRIEVKDFAAEKADVHTSNGSIYLNGLCYNIIGRTSNGTITVYSQVVEDGLMDLHTSNGRVKVVICDQEVGVDLDTSTSMGSINLDFPALVYQTKVEKHMRREYRAKSENISTCKRKLRVKAVTSMGSIYIGRSDV